MLARWKSSTQVSWAQSNLNSAQDMNAPAFTVTGCRKIQYKPSTEYQGLLKKKTNTNTLVLDELISPNKKDSGILGSACPCSMPPILMRSF